MKFKESYKFRTEHFGDKNLGMKRSRVEMSCNPRRLNNNQYILTSLQKFGILNHIALTTPDFEVTYKDMIMDQKRHYFQSWAKVLHYIWSKNTGNLFLVCHKKMDFTFKFSFTLPSSNEFQDIQG